MKSLAVRLCNIVGLMVLAAMLAAVYGVVNDQITVTLSPEYFSVFKRQQFSDALRAFDLADAPTRVQAVLVGVLATWWFGLLLGAVLGAVGTLGRRPPLHTREFLRVVVGVMAFTVVLSVLFGAVAYATEPAVRPDADQWPFLEGISHVRGAFSMGWWHDGAYLGGVLGTMLACFWTRRRRRVLSTESVRC